jgi:pilus assembly protein CpaE
VSFISNKGGVGKSTLAVNAAVGLALRHPNRVLLIDASLQLGVAASMLDLHPRVTLTDAATERSRLDETMIRQMITPHDSGLHLLAAPADAVEATAVDDEVISRVISLAKRVYDFIVVDTFPLFDRVVMAVLDLSDRAYIVLENVVPTIQGAAQLLQVLDNIGFPKERQRIVLNRMTSVAGGLSADDVATRLDSDIDHVLAYDKRIIAAANIGRPYVMYPHGVLGFFNQIGRAFNALIREMEALQLHRNGQAVSRRDPEELAVNATRRTHANAERSDEMETIDER